ncbi:MAG TPA: amidase [Candidatus Acidoferrales bacterium]|nr:amidase [Candidatus Acidoferrales bacterium]
MNKTELPFATIAEIADLFRAGKLSPVELTELMLARIEGTNPKLNAFITVTDELARVQAKRAEVELGIKGKRKTRVDRGLLHGIPLSLKDNVCTEGIRTTAGSKILRDYFPERDAAVVTRLKQSGAVLVGKNNMHEFAYGVTNNNPHYGAARNPWDNARIPGGSSGGSAAAVAAGLCFGSIGTDTGGSIRIPAALCGIVGCKPGLGRVDATGVIPLSVTHDCVGPLARTAGDAAILFRAIVEGRNGRREGERRGKSSARKLSKLQLGIPREIFFDVISDEVEKSFDAAVRCTRGLGAKIQEISIPLLAETEKAGNRIAWAEASYYHQQSGWFPGLAEEYGEDVRSRLEMGMKVLAVEYLEAQDQRRNFISQLREVMEQEAIDALMVPTIPVAAPLIGEESTRVGKTEHPTRALLLRLNRPANLAGVPAISVPCGFTGAGLPMGLQFIGAEHGEQLLLDIADAYQRANLPSRIPSDFGT